jgi:hypothetical protein
MNKIENVILFNTYLDKFILHLELKVPLIIPDLFITKTYLQTVRLLNPKLVVENFMYYMINYKTEINECDEDFFLNFENNPSLKSKMTKSDNLMNGFKFKKIWTSNLSLEDKSKIFLYMKKLLELGEKII